MKHPILNGMSIIVVGLGAFCCSKSGSFEGECKRDADCSDYERCDTMDFRCVCWKDEACALGEFCNLSGSCQRKTGCFSNAECSPGSICDVESGACIGVGSCTKDFHCEIGQICTQGLCQDGCRDTADCDLLQREVCLGGVCTPGRCENKRYCDFSFLCNHETHNCEAASEWYCKPGCSLTCEGCTDKSLGPCGNPANVCIREETENFCWVACSAHEDCPNGYDCGPTRVGWLTAPCDTKADCIENLPPDDQVINVCDGKGTPAARCRLSKQPCETDTDCYSFDTICLNGDCVFAFHCSPPGGCQ